MSHIFVAEDDPDIRTSIGEILREEGYDVGEYATLEDMLLVLHQGVRPCLVLVDLVMPGMSGQEFLETVRADASFRDIPVVMMTGAKITMADIEVLRKPFELDDLVTAVSRHCAHAEADSPRSRAKRGDKPRLPPT